METVTVSEFISKLGITSEAEYIGYETEVNGDKNWNADHWKVVLSRKDVDGRKKLTVDYWMGIGHNGKTPETDSVLDSLILDSQSGDPDYCRGFEDFCSNFGYDTDSRKAEKIFKQCQHISRRLEKFLGTENYQKAIAEVERL